MYLRVWIILALIYPQYDAISFFVTSGIIYLYTQRDNQDLAIRDIYSFLRVKIV